MRRFLLPAFALSALALAALALAALALAARPLPAAAAPTPLGADTAFLDGSFALASGDPGVAARYFTQALARRPQDSLLLHRAFAAALMAGTPEAATLARRLPGNDAATLLLIAGDVRARRFAAAAARLSGLRAIGPAGPLMPVLSAWLDLAQGHQHRALAALAPRVAASDAAGFFLLQAGLIADVSGQTAAAQGFYHRARQALGVADLRVATILASFDARHQRRPRALSTLAAMTAGSPEFAIALPALTASLDHRPVATPADGIAEAFLGLGATLRAADRPEAALLMLRLALAARPGFAPARLLAAELLGDQGKTADALALLDGIARTDPLTPVADLQRADLLRRAGKPTQALAVLTRLETRFPQSPLPYAEAGDVLRDLHHPHQAAAAYTRALALSVPLTRRDWVLLYNRGIARDSVHDWAGAEADFRHALTLLPDQPLVLNYLGYSWADRGVHLNRALTMIEMAAKQRPDSAAITDSLGWVLYRRHDIAHALTVEQRAAEMAPADATINAHLGDVYWAAGHRLQARYQWQRALTLGPSPAEAAAIRARLREGLTAALARAPEPH
ncbi:MAG: tetratricopeptide repeat protein [Acetobacteraceae bacterium]